MCSAYALENKGDVLWSAAIEEPLKNFSVGGIYQQTMSVGEKAHLLQKIIDSPEASVISVFQVNSFPVVS